MKRTLILTGIAVGLTLLSLVYFFWLRPARESQRVAAEEPARPFGGKTPIVAPGVVEAVSEEVEVGAEIGGKLRAVLVEEGAAVSRGQTIAVLENADFEARVADAKTRIETLRRQQETAAARVRQATADRDRVVNGARVEERREARAGYETTLPNVANARRELDRRERLFATGDVSREEVERARTAYENAQKQSETSRARFEVVDAGARRDDLEKADAAIRLAEAQVREFDALIREAEAGVRTAEAALAKTIVRAPFAGIVLRKRLKDGESVSPESPTGIVTIADVSALRVRVDLDERDVARVRENQPAYFTAEAYGDRRFTGRVVRVGQILGRKNFRTEKPTEKVDTKILEVLVELDAGQNPPLGLRVDSFIETGE
ncbi:MAG: efflux RND transporter periplasmic adaptor subunit [Acidobacteria bacterium]|nr:efflux RND transporter periplasmic adaptor subunit [Acidobacteriota bacterium]